MTQYTLLGALLILVLLLVVVILYAAKKICKCKKECSKQTTNKSLGEPSRNIEEIIVDQYDNAEQTIFQLQEIQELQSEELIEEEELLGSEEGDFGVDESQIQQQESTTKITKRDVPPHGKITKEHFREFAGTRILLAEDNMINQKVILGLLAESGIEVVVANDGQEALDILEQDDNFLLILMDAHMPRVDGFEATRKIRENARYDHILVVALSGDTAADDIRKMTEAGMQEHLEKPLRMDALYDILYAYSSDNDDDKGNDDDLIEVVKTKELDGERGLEICGGDEGFYHEILAEFLQTYSNSDQQLLDMMQNNDLESAAKLLLDIIGVSANIGATKLNYTAGIIKDSLSDTEEKSYLTLMNQYQHHLKNLIKDIQEYEAKA